jgi:hypothetical protein
MKPRAIVASLGLMLLLVGCSSGSGSGPSAGVSPPDRTAGPARTSQAAEPTTKEAKPETTKAETTKAEPTKAEPTKAETTSAEAPGATSAAEAPAASASAAAEASSGSNDAWIWVVVALVAIALVIGLIVARGRSGRKKDWEAGYTGAVSESEWLRSELLPVLIGARTRSEQSGGWRVARARVMALADKLEGLRATAPDEAGALRSSTLLQPVRALSTALDAPPSTPPGVVEPAVNLAAVHRQLSDALATVRPPG